MSSSPSLILPTTLASPFISALGKDETNCNLNEVNNNAILETNMNANTISMDDNDETELSHNNTTGSEEEEISEAIGSVEDEDGEGEEEDFDGTGEYAGLDLDEYDMDWFDPNSDTWNPTPKLVEESPLIWSSQNSNEASWWALAAASPALWYQARADTPNSRDQVGSSIDPFSLASVDLDTESVSELRSQIASLTLPPPSNHNNNNKNDNKDARKNKNENETGKSPTEQSNDTNANAQSNRNNSNNRNYYNNNKLVGFRKDGTPIYRGYYQGGSGGGGYRHNKKWNPNANPTAASGPGSHIPYKVNIGNASKIVTPDTASSSSYGGSGANISGGGNFSLPFPGRTFYKKPRGYSSNTNTNINNTDSVNNSSIQGGSKNSDDSNLNRLPPYPYDRVSGTLRARFPHHVKTPAGRPMGPLPPFVQQNLLLRLRQQRQEEQQQKQREQEQQELQPQQRQQQQLQQAYEQPQAEQQKDQARLPFDGTEQQQHRQQPPPLLTSSDSNNTVNNANKEMESQERQPARTNLIALLPPDRKSVV